MTSRRSRRYVTAVVIAAVSIGCGVALDISGDAPDQPAPGSDAASDAASGDAPGDGMATGDESAAGDAQSDGAAVDAGPLAKIVFVSRNSVIPGTTKIIDGQSTSNAASFNAVCVYEAKSASLPGTYVAWLSYNGGGGGGVDAIDTIMSDGPWHMPSTTAGPSAALVFPSKSYLADGGSPMMPITIGANGLTVVPPFAYVWTGTNTLGKRSNQDCSVWADRLGGMGTYGRFGATDFQWTAFAVSGDCTPPYHVICFQN